MRVASRGTSFPCRRQAIFISVIDLRCSHFYKKTNIFEQRNSFTMFSILQTPNISKTLSSYYVAPTM